MRVDFPFPRHLRIWQQIIQIMDTSDLAHDGLHVLRVYDVALRLAHEAESDADLAGAAALVHDMASPPKDDPARALGGEQSATASVRVLQEAGYVAREIEQITDAVRTSSWSRGLAPSSLLGMILQDADRLDAIGAIGIARTFTTAQAMVSRGKELVLYDLDDPLARRGRQPDDSSNALDHFTVKLLRLAQGMHLPAAKQLAARRHEIMEDFLNALAEEIAA